MMVCRSSKDVWHDVYSKSRYFVSSYLNSYPERAMVKLQRGQSIKTELNGFWFNGRVDTVDASMARICFASEKRFEWIYRGSTRFRHLYDLLANAEARKKQGNRRPTRPIHNMSLVHKKKNAPYVEYTGGNAEVCPPAPPSPSLLTSQSSQVILKWSLVPVDVIFKINSHFRMESELSQKRALPKFLNHLPHSQRRDVRQIPVKLTT